MFDLLTSSASHWWSTPAPGRRHPTHKPDKSRLRPKPQRHLHCAFLVCFESDLLRQHDVAGGEVALGHEAPAAYRPSLCIQLVHILLLPFLDVVALAGLGTDDFEPSVSLVLDELLGGKPFFQEGFGFGLGFGLGRPQGCQSLETGSRTRSRRMRGMYSHCIYIIAAFVEAARRGHRRTGAERHSPAHQPWHEQHFRRRRIELGHLARRSLSSLLSRRVAEAGKLLEALRRLRNCSLVGGIELEPAFASVVHDNLNGHVERSFHVNY